MTQSLKRGWPWEGTGRQKSPARGEELCFPLCVHFSIVALKLQPLPESPEAGWRTDWWTHPPEFWSSRAEVGLRICIPGDAAASPRNTLCKPLLYGGSCFVDWWEASVVTTSLHSHDAVPYTWATPHFLQSWSSHLSLAVDSTIFTLFCCWAIFLDWGWMYDALHNVQRVQSLIPCLQFSSSFH